MIRVLMISSACLLLAGCWEPSDVTFHEPGEYLGSEDNYEADTNALRERFQGQLDR